MSEKKVNTNTESTTNTTPETNKSESKIKLTRTGDFFAKVADSESSVTYSASALEKYAGKTAATAYARDAFQLYKYASLAADLREAGDSSLPAAEAALKEHADTMFKAMGTRPGKKDADGKETLRPAYGVRTADFVIFGEIAADARNTASSPEAVPEKFAELLAVAVGRILAGKPLGRISVEALRESKEAANAAATAKRAETKKRKEEKAAAEQEEAEKKAAAEKEAAEKEEAEKNAMRERLLRISAQSQDLKVYVNASHASDEEKAHIVSVLDSFVG